MFYVGLDWADRHHDLVVLDEAGHRVATRRVAHSPQGLAELKTLLLGIASHPEELVCVVETSHGLLITFLLEAGIPVYPVNPQTANRLRKTAGAKTDQIDACLLAKTARFSLPDLRRLSPDSPIITELKTLTRDQDALVVTQTRLVNQLKACLKDYYPAALNLFGKLHKRSALLFLQTYPTAEAAAKASSEEIITLLSKVRYPHPRLAAERIISELQRPALVASESMVRAKSRLMLALVKQLLIVIEEIKGYEEAITALFLTHEDATMWRTLPRAGKRLAPRLLSEWGDDRSRYGDASSIQMLAGTAPVPFQSGNFAKAHKRLACVKPWRNILYQFAWQTTLSQPWAASYYQRKRTEGKSHSMAVRALANVWVRIIFRLWQDRASYQATVFEEAKLVHAKRVA